MGKALRYVGLIVVGLVVLAAILGAAYYQQDIATFIRLEGWNSGGAEQAVREFIKKGHAGDPGAGRLLDTAFVKPVEQKGKLTAVQHPGAGGPVTVPLSRVVPAGEAKAVASRIKYKKGAYEVAVQYPNGQWAAFDVGRVEGVWKINAVPDSLSPTQPKPQPWD
jgi:hypothetical protein